MLIAQINHSTKKKRLNMWCLRGEEEEEENEAARENNNKKINHTNHVNVLQNYKLKITLFTTQVGAIWETHTHTHTFTFTSTGEKIRIQSSNNLDMQLSVEQSLQFQRLNLFELHRIVIDSN